MAAPQRHGLAVVQAAMVVVYVGVEGREHVAGACRLRSKILLGRPPACSRMCRQHMAAQARRMGAAVSATCPHADAARRAPPLRGGVPKRRSAPQPPALPPHRLPTTWPWSVMVEMASCSAMACAGVNVALMVGNTCLGGGMVW